MLRDDNKVSTGFYYCAMELKLEDDKESGLLHLSKMVFLWTAGLNFDPRLRSYSAPAASGEQHKVSMGLRFSYLKINQHTNKRSYNRGSQEICCHIAMVPAFVR